MEFLDLHALGEKLRPGPSSVTAAKDDSMSAEDILRLTESERVGIENSIRIESIREDLTNSYRRIEKIETKIDRLSARVIQTGAIVGIVLPIATAFIINALS
tara:strand:- start:736 stop:1041 length:306 start_codon:yes stop_codon:yes gene_type:complete